MSTITPVLQPPILSFIIPKADWSILMCIHVGVWVIMLIYILLCGISRGKFSRTSSLCSIHGMV